MKNFQSLAIFLSFILLKSFLCSNEMENNEKPFRGYFYIQRFYPGNDIIDSIKESEFHTELMFFEVNKDVIFIAKSLARINDIEGKKIKKFFFYKNKKRYNKM
jgi:hypothetical protein